MEWEHVPFLVWREAISGCGGLYTEANTGGDGGGEEKGERDTIRSNKAPTLFFFFLSTATKITLNWSRDWVCDLAFVFVKERDRLGGS